MSQTNHVDMDIKTVHKSLDLLEASNIKVARLLGGEPTIHPHFNEIIDVCIARGFRIMLFSGGIVPKGVVDKLRSIPEDIISILINVTFPDIDSHAHVRKQLNLFKSLGNKIIPGVNIATPAINLDFILSLILDYNLRPIVRLGIAHPNLDAKNAYLFPRHYPEVGRQIALFAKQARSNNIDIEYDCGFVPCMFPTGFFEHFQNKSDNIGLRCNPVLDILPSGEVISCYALSSYHRVKIEKDDTTQRIQEHFTLKLSQERTITLYKHCDKCQWKQNAECVGGCLSSSMLRQRRITI